MADRLAANFLSKRGRPTVNGRSIALPIVSLAMVATGVFLSERAATVAIALIVVGAGMFFIGALAPTLAEFQIGPGGFSAKLRERESEMRATLEPDTERLTRTATWLAGSPEAGGELVEQALIDACLHWPRAKQVGPSEAVRKRLVDLSPPPTRAPSQPPDRGAATVGGRAGELLGEMAKLPVGERSALVFKLLEGVGEEALRTIDPRSPVAMQDDLERGARALASALGLDPEAGS